MEEKEAEAWKKDIKSMVDIDTDCENTTPIWLAWNSNLIPRDDGILYLPQINMSQTSNEVVLQTLKKTTTYARGM